MTDDAVAQPGTVALEPPSTVLNPQTVPNAPGNGTPSLSEGKESNSPADVMEAELARLKGEDAEKGDGEKKPEPKDEKADKAKDADKAKVEDKAKAEEKPEKARGNDGKFAKGDGDKPDAKAVEGEAAKPATERAGQDDTRQSEGRKHTEPPARFLPEARTKWANVPNEVKTEVHRVTAEYDAELERVRPAAEAYESVKEYDEMAKSAGTTMKDAMRNYVEIDKLLLSNPAQGFARIMQSIGITPQQLVQEITKNPQAFQLAPQQPSPQPQQQVSPEVQRLQQENQELRHDAIVRAAQPIIDAFAADHADFSEKWPTMQAIIRSGVITELYGTGLTPAQRLAEAYRMAGGNAPSQSAPQALPDHSDASAARPAKPDAGTKSVRGAPNDGDDTPTDEEPTELREMLRKELRKIA